MPGPNSAAVMSKPFIGPNELDVASQAIVRARFLLTSFGDISDPSMMSLDRLAEIILDEMMAGCFDEDALVSAALKKFTPNGRPNK